MATQVRLAALALVVLLLAPSALAHIQGSRPLLQRSERDRIIGLNVEGLGLRADLSLTGDPLRQVVTHFIDPSRGIFYVEHRADASRPDQRFFAQWQFERLVEYRDQNVNGLYEPQTDTAVKAWRFEHYQWSREPVRRAQVADVTGNDILWEANLTGGPHIRAEVVVAGLPFVDEGAVVRPQDVALYLDFTQMPQRALGALYAIDLSVTVQADTALSFHVAENTSTALLADAPGRRAMLVWGGEAVLDGNEQRLDATLAEERVGEDGNKTARLRLHLPTVDESMRFVMVSALEYESENRRTPLAPHVALLALLLVPAVFRRRVE